MKAVMAKWIGLLLPAVSLFADEVHLKNGAVIQGVVTRQDKNRITVEIGQGILQLDASQVERVVRSESSALQEFQARFSALDAGAEAADFWKLADWCASHGVSSQVRDLVLRALKLDADFRRMSRPDFVARLVRDGVSDELVKTCVELGLFTVRFEEKDFKGLSPELAEWFMRRQAPPADPKPAEPEKAKEERPAPPPQPQPVFEYLPYPIVYGHPYYGWPYVPVVVIVPPPPTPPPPVQPPTPVLRVRPVQMPFAGYVVKPPLASAPFQSYR
jgi:hypothetical protein